MSKSSCSTGTPCTSFSTHRFVPLQAWALLLTLFQHSERLILHGTYQDKTWQDIAQQGRTGQDMTGRDSSRQDGTEQNGTWHQRTGQGRNDRVAYVVFLSRERTKVPALMYTPMMLVLVGANAVMIQELICVYMHSTHMRDTYILSKPLSYHRHSDRKSLIAIFSTTGILRLSNLDLHIPWNHRCRTWSSESRSPGVE